MAGRIIRSGAEKVLSALFAKYSIVKRKQDGKYLARADRLGKRYATKAGVPKDGIFDTVWQALEFIREVRKEPNLPWTEITLDEESYEEFAHPRH